VPTDVLLTLWRHGEAAPGRVDMLRELTPAGERSLAAGARRFDGFLANRGYPSITALRFSPAVRTRQTAAILQSALSITEAEVDDVLAPGARPDFFREVLVQPEAHVLWVSHQPFVSRAVALWCDDPTLAPISPGGWATLSMGDFSRGGATLLHIEPDPIMCP